MALKKLEKQQKITHYIMGIVIGIYTLLFFMCLITATVIRLKNEKPDLYNFIFLLLMLVECGYYLCLAGAFLAIGLIMIYNLKKHFPEYYNKSGGYVWLATSGLCLPLLVRCVNTVLGIWCTPYIVTN